MGVLSSALNPWNPPPKTGLGEPMEGVDSGFAPLPKTILLVPEKLLKPDIGCPKFCTGRVDALVVIVVTEETVDIMEAGFLSATTKFSGKKKD